jgi:hypothetical protein
MKLLFMKLLILLFYAMHLFMKACHLYTQYYNKEKGKMINFFSRPDQLSYFKKGSMHLDNDNQLKWLLFCKITASNKKHSSVDL